MTVVRTEWRQMILDGDLVSSDQAAAIAGVAEGTIRQWVRRRHLRPVNPGMPVAMYRRADVERCESARLVARRITRV